MTRLALALALLLLAGCATAPHAVTVRTRQADGSWRHGQGVVLDRYHVATVAHASTGDVLLVTEGRWGSGAVVEELRATGSIEPVAILRTRRAMPWHGCEVRRIKAGDSGSPVVGQDGRVIGLVWGYQGDGTVSAVPVEAQ